MQMEGETMKMRPMTQQQAMTVGLLPKGNYDFLVKKAIIKMSKNGNPMVELLLSIWNQEGIERQMYDYLMDMEGFDAKLRHFCYAIGLGEMSENGEFDCKKVINKTGCCKVYVKEDKSGQWPPKNAIGDYILSKDNEENKNFKDDELPF